ncbi:MAG: GTPase Era [Vicinamibacteria bacterium]|nr:GTPase Era [Vicinamibacteria bacterium]
MSESTPSGFKCGYVTIVGRPSAGKSTLLNRLVGEKVAITSDKPQTTRNRILGYVNRPNGQIAFIDTPGLIKPFHAMHTRMMSVAHSAIGEADVVIWMVDTTERDGPHNRPIADLLRQSGKPVILALNKVDKAAKTQLLPLMAGLGNRLNFKAVNPISARTGDGVEGLLKAILAELSEGPALFPADEFTDKSERFLVSELIRESIIQCCGQEVPYATAVLVRAWEDEREQGGKIRIAADIMLEREGQKAIVIGKQGSMLKKIGTAARTEIEALLDAPVYLELFVKVRKGWREDDRAVREVIEGH